MGTKSIAKGVGWCAPAAVCLCLAVSVQSFATGLDSIGGDEAPIVTGYERTTGDPSNGLRIPDAAGPAELAEVLSPLRGSELAGPTGWPAESLRDPVRQTFSAGAPVIPGAIIAQSDPGFAREGARAGTGHVLAVARGSRGTADLLGAAAIALGAVTLLGAGFFTLVWRRS